MRESKTRAALVTLLALACLSILTAGASAGPSPTVDGGSALAAITGGQSLDSIDGPGYHLPGMDSVLNQATPTPTNTNTATPTQTPTQTPTATATANSIQATQTAVAATIVAQQVAATQTAVAATLTAAVPPATLTAVATALTAAPLQTQTAVALAATQTQTAANATATVRVQQTSIAIQTAILLTPVPTSQTVLLAGQVAGQCSKNVGDICQIGNAAGPAVPAGQTSGTTGTWRQNGSGVFNVAAPIPAAAVPNSLPQIFLPTTAGVEAYVGANACTAVPAAAPFGSTACNGTTVGNLLQGAVVTVRFVLTTGAVADVVGIAIGPGAAAVVAAPIIPPVGLPAAVPQVAIPAVPRPPVQFIPAAPAPLLPPGAAVAPLGAPAPTGAMAAPARYPEVPVIPETDTGLLVLGGLGAIGAIALLRRRQRRDG